MSQKNDTPALIVSLLITLALIGGGIWWLNTSNLLRGLFPSSGTSTESPVESDGSSTSASPPAATADSFAGVPNVPTGLFNYGGSTTWAPIRGTVDPVIATAHPGFQLRYTEPLSGTPGSATGIRMLLKNELAFSQSSRAPKAEEFQEAQQRGYSLREIPVAIEGIAIAVHPDLNAAGLTVAQLRDIYTGRITNWSEVGGPDLPITAYSRRVEDSGTVEFFVENVLGGEPLNNRVRLISTTTQALRDVSTDRGGIYFASAPEVVGQCTTKPLPIGREANQLVPPYQGQLVPSSQCPAQRNQLNASALQSGQYPLTRRLFVIVKQNGQPDQQAGEAYANLLLTNQGQDLLSQAGFVRIR
jgi:phosphate transport system substrate-binding protein